jgi:hypothetical protein
MEEQYEHLSEQQDVKIWYLFNWFGADASGTLL